MKMVNLNKICFQFRKDTSELESNLSPINAAQNCAKTSGRLCLGLSITLILCYTYIENVLVLLLSIIEDLIINILIFSINCYKFKAKNVLSLMKEAYAFLKKYELIYGARDFKNCFNKFYKTYHRFLKMIKCCVTNNIHLTNVGKTNFEIYLKIKYSSIMGNLSRTSQAVVKHHIGNIGKEFKFIYTKILESNYYQTIRSCDIVVLLTCCGCNVSVINVLVKRNYRYFKILLDKNIIRTI